MTGCIPVRRAFPWFLEAVVASALVVMTVRLGIQQDWQSLSLLVLVIAYLGWQVFQVWRLDKRLRFPKKGIKPLAYGVWHSIPEKIDAIQRRDRKRKKKLGKVLNNYQQSVGALPDATVVIDEKQGVEWWNSKAVEILGVTGKMVQGKKIGDLLSDPVFQSYLQTGDFSQPIQIPAPLDDGILLEARIVPFSKGKLLLQVRDISRLAQLETVRRDFVANVSHEMRTPLTVIHGYLETLADNEDAALRPWRMIIDQMQQQSSRMQRIVEDLLLLSRLESGPGTRREETIDVLALLETIEGEARCLSGEEKHVIQIEADPDLSISGVASEIESAFSNLVFNAVRYTPAGGEVKIRWWRSANGPCYSVSDKGIGIAAEHIPRLSERFYRVDVGRSRKSGGTGLGLAIVKHVLQRHGAYLEIQSKPGVGSTFSCCFPQSCEVGVPALKAS